MRCGQETPSVLTVLLISFSALECVCCRVYAVRALGFGPAPLARLCSITTTLFSFTPRFTFHIKSQSYQESSSFASKRVHCIDCIVRKWESAGAATLGSRRSRGFGIRLSQPRVTNFPRIKTHRKTESQNFAAYSPCLERSLECGLVW